MVRGDAVLLACLFVLLGLGCWLLQRIAILPLNQGLLAVFGVNFALAQEVARLVQRQLEDVAKGPLWPELAQPGVRLKSRLRGGALMLAPLLLAEGVTFAVWAGTAAAAFGLISVGNVACAAGFLLHIRGSTLAAVAGREAPARPVWLVHLFQRPGLPLRVCFILATAGAGLAAALAFPRAAAVILAISAAAATYQLLAIDDQVLRLQARLPGSLLSLARKTFAARALAALLLGAVPAAVIAGGAGALWALAAMLAAASLRLLEFLATIPLAAPRRRIIEARLGLETLGWVALTLVFLLTPAFVPLRIGLAWRRAERLRWAPG